MNRNHGFTLVELLITMTIMVILITLAVVNLRGSQMTARDDQRSVDIQTIARQLESYYQTGNSTGTSGEYPPLDAIASEAQIMSTLTDLDPAVLRAPNISDTDPVSFIAATDNNPQTPTASTYIYQPLQSDGELCGSAGDECRRFFLYYMLESEPGIVKKIISKNQ